MSTVEDIESVLCEFIEAIIHEVLHLRAIYPAELFSRQRLYNIAVRKSRHPKLNDYIYGVVQSIKEPLVHGVVEKVAVLILDSCGCVVERYVISMRVQPEILQSTDLDDVESALRSCLLKLQYADAALAPLTKGCTFEVVAYTTYRSSVPAESWVEGEPASPDSSTGGDLPSLMPIKSAQAGSGAFRVNLYAEY